MVVFLKQPKVRNIGGILAGLGVLFIGMEMMSTAMMPLRDSKAFIDMMTKFSNPLLGILAGAIFTALIHEVPVLHRSEIDFEKTPDQPQEKIYLLFLHSVGTDFTLGGQIFLGGGRNIAQFVLSLFGLLHHAAAEKDRKSTRLNSSHPSSSRMPSSA